MKSPDRLLIVDDVPDNLFLVRTILEDEGYEIITSSNGHDALKIIESEPPDLVLLDVMMPLMDGYEVTRRMRGMKDLPFIPILLITAYDRANAVKGLDLGADEFIRKPIEADELLARVRSLLRLKHSIAERDRIDRQRQDFVSRLTHDLRTPLVAADRMLGLLQDGVLGEISPEIREALTIMGRSNHNLLEMVNKLLDVYRYESGSKTINLQPLDLKELLNQVVQELKPIAISKNLELTAELDDIATVKGDRLELLRVFNNLIGNALKFTESGSVHVSLKLEESEAIMAIADTGAGISLDEQPFLFQRFRQGNHQKQGSGLGLYLSHYIINAHNGKILVKSPNLDSQKGSTFFVHLPTITS
ncbi:hybrid sensor histidine kinase/response regulator [Pseudanabaena galeata UHCC 0370]|jgi:two-component system, sensor histidine kinase and response regulator|uniref:histidine kinase n=1 Tax=Pseudanabaena galeata UHCC 0370 TaxID=3110310 RepID=A0ABU5TNK9_9CYAN|nr:MULTISPECIES: hybrid sensor histidine kinase/response regulator [Pseudanabaena]MEA5479745.1 hybrid sensor histidine kinase/response regulator [Pseudanabaena galeata UHCC 0370]MEA5485968.1 hybrid sensor histidine kinase/response regulator [Pseudanabaena sp. CCNP1317]WGS72971.1 hybrid sensor histidine kinase/response regulator [Pseudanabaena galeata CCNP1313]